MKYITGTLLFFYCLSAHAQDLSGFWKGTFRMQGCFTSNNIELQFNMQNGMISGDSYHFQDVDNYVKKTLTASYNPSTKKLTVLEGQVTMAKIPDRCVICIKEFQLSYSKTGNTETLRGLWTGKVLNTNQDCGVDSIILTRTKESAFKEIPEIKVDTGTIRLDFYDNATIDGDSITVMVNKKVVFSNHRLTAEPATTYIHVDALQPFYEIEMIAENEGSIPPNTAMLIITAGEKKHRLNLSSSQVKSARVRIVYDGKAFQPDNPPGLSMR